MESRIFRKENPWRILSFLGVLQLPGQDSNLDKENQNLLCYRYTTGYQVVLVLSLHDCQSCCKLWIILPKQPLRVKHPLLEG